MKFHLSIIVAMVFATSTILLSSSWSSGSVSALSLPPPPPSSSSAQKITTKSMTTRDVFFRDLAAGGAAAFTLVGGVSGILVSDPSPAYARGRATLEQAYDRYTPRILAGGDFYKTKLKAMIAKEDWEGIKQALQEPPKKSKSDRSKQDGGFSERAAQAGQFSDSRVIAAMDLYAATFSDNSVSPKTKAMQKEVAELRNVVEGMKSIAKQVTGEEPAGGGGGLFGISKKQPSKSELTNKMKELYIIGGTSWNKYIFAANDGLPVSLNKLPYL
eukprot:CAMPEP_0113452744 /NCGR_PEP_ID=MMETSP0014_2-20120614/7002_1 /TAXON_ID=2857 /ORGANISM="Nitzschia sp." /LENGTH=271 /DNA_ID=CAMNT_0000344121 /DNA_START=150 /DNA_END=965 /DNA_ORIENTATION=+ /assembly_acc=CAM_ASM_000159